MNNQWTQEIDRLRSIIANAHGALADAATVSIPGLDQDIAPAIRELTAERDRLRTLAVDLAGALADYLDVNDKRKSLSGCFCRLCNTRRALEKARKEGVIE